MREFLENLHRALVPLYLNSPYTRDGGRSLHVVINPSAGGLVKEKKRKNLLSVLSGLGGNLPVKAASPALLREKIIIHVSEYPGHLGIIAVSLLEKTREGNGAIFVMSLGGDGSHLELMTGLWMGDRSLLKNVLVQRLPAGTGNDAADAWSLEQGFKTFLEGGHLAQAGVIEIRGPHREPRFAFNIVSLGLDAYVVHLNNIFKSFIPGNFYKIFTDVGVLFYGLTQGYRRTELNYRRPDHSEGRIDQESGIIVLGVSGFRTYGNEKWVLPDENNLCVIKRGGLIQNMYVKNRLFKASHGSLKVCSMDTAVELKVDGAGRMLVQCDGEVAQLEEGDFPLEFRILETDLRTLSSKQTSKLKACRYLSQIRS